MKHMIIFFITIWTHIILGSVDSDPLLGKKYIVCNEEFYKEAEKKGTPNPYYFQKILENIFFDFSFVSSANNMDNFIILSVVDITSAKSYQPEKHDKLVINMIQINKDGSFGIFFKKDFSEIEFQLLKGCLSYTYKKDKKLVVNQNLIAYLYKASVEGKNLQNSIIDNFSHIASPKEADIIIPIYVILNPEEKKSLLDTWALISSQDPDEETITIPFMKNDSVIQNLDGIVTAFNNEYKKFIDKLKIELAESNQNNKPNENKPSKINYLMMQYGLPALGYTKQYGPTALDYTLRYGLPVAQAYSAYSTIRSSYQSVGSLQSFLKVPRTKTGKVKALINTYSLYSSFLTLYGYTKASINWLQGKTYGNKK